MNPQAIVVIVGVGLIAAAIFMARRIRRSVSLSASVTTPHPRRHVNRRAKLTPFWG